MVTSTYNVLSVYSKASAYTKPFLAGEAALQRWSVPSHYGGWAAEVIIRTKISTPSTSPTALRSSSLCCSGQNFPVTVSSRWKWSKSLRAAVCALLVFLSKTRRMLKLGWRMEIAPLRYKPEPWNPSRSPKPSSAQSGLWWWKAEKKAKRKKASLNKPKQEPADCEKVHWAARGSPSCLSYPGKSQETMENATLWWTAWKSLSLSLEMCVWPRALQTGDDNV